MQGQGNDSRAASRSNGAVLRTSVSIPFRSHGLDQTPADSPISQPPSALMSRVSLTPSGLRADLASAPRPPPFPAAASSQLPTSAQTDSAMQTAHVDQHASSSGQGSSASSQSALASHMQSSRGCKQRPYSARASTQAKESHLVKRRVQRPHSAMSHVVQPPFWTGSMQQAESSQQHASHRAIEDSMERPLPDEGHMQQPRSQQGRMQRPQSAGQSRSSARFETSRLSDTQEDVSHAVSASSQHMPLKTVPEDMPACMQSGTDSQGTSAEGRTQSLRAWQDTYSQPRPGTSEAASSFHNPVKHGSSRPLSAERQHNGQQHASGLPVQQAAKAQRQPRDEGGALAPSDVSRRSSTPPRPRGRSTLSRADSVTPQGPTLDLTHQERCVCTPS